MEKKLAKIEQASTVNRNLRRIHQIIEDVGDLLFVHFGEEMCVDLSPVVCQGIIYLSISLNP